MGYYTYFNLKVINDDEVSTERVRQASNRLKQEVLEEPLGDDEVDFAWLSYDCMKWYESSTDMIALSKEFPEMVFCLYGDGEESDDFWRAYYKDGKECLQEIHMYYDPPPMWAKKGK